MHKKPAEKKKKFFRFSLMHFFMQKWEFLGALQRTRVQILPPTTTKRKFCGALLPFAKNSRSNQKIRQKNTIQKDIYDKE